MLRCSLFIACTVVWITTAERTDGQVSDDFQDGNFTQSPAWSAVGDSPPVIATDPVEPTNFVLLGSNNGIAIPFQSPWAGFSVRFEGYVPPAQSGEGLRVSLYAYSTSPRGGGYGIRPLLSFNPELVAGALHIQEFDEHAPSFNGGFTLNGGGQWLGVRVWHDTALNLIRGEVRRSANGELLSAHSFTPSVDLSSAAPAVGASFGFDGPSSYADKVEFVRLCIGDVAGSGDQTVGLSDLATLLANFGTTGGAMYADGDVDFDRDVDLSDLAILLANFGTSCP